MSYNGFGGGGNGDGGGYGGGGGGYGGGGGGYGYGGGGGGYGGGGGGYGGGGYGGGRGRRNDRGRGPRGGGGGGRTAPETTAVRMRKMIIKYADDEDFDAVEDPPRLAKVLRRGWREGAPGVLDGFRYGVTEMPFKQHHYVTLLMHLSYRLPEEGGEEDPQTGEKRPREENEADCGREVLEELGRSFRTAVEGREWLNARLLLQFLSLLVPAGLVDARSILEVYKGLLTVTNEVGGGGDRAERAARAVGEGLIRSAHALVDTFPEELSGLSGSLDMFIAGRRGNRSLVNPFAPIPAEGEELEAYADPLSDLMSALQDLRSNDWKAPAVLPRPFENAILPEGAEILEPYAIASVSMPPEMYDVDEENPQDCEGRIGGLVLFGESAMPSTNTVLGWTLRSLILDTLNIFEVNRKECARFLLSLPRYLTPGTFKSEDSESTYSLESTVINTILSALCTLPNSPHRPLFYGSVITEMCKLSPATVAPPVGRGVRRLFTQLGEDGLDVEVSRRISDWFAIHLSNFGFQWMWKEWIPDLELPASHPRRAFMRRVVEQEIRLAYHDRILQTLPEPMFAKGAEVVSEEVPDPTWSFESPSAELHHEAVDLLKRMKQKAPSHEVKRYINELPGAMTENDTLSAPIVQMVGEAVLKLGDRSFSHFLNATERYLDVLRYATSDHASRRVLLDAIQSFWSRSCQQRLITVDKYLQYSILEPLDVVDWVFAEDVGSSPDAPDGWTDVYKWELLRMTLDKVVGRVVRERRLLRSVDKADEVARARRAAERLERGDAVGMEDEDDDGPPERSLAAQDAQAALDIQTSRLERVFAAVVRRFAAELLPWAYGAEGNGLKGVLSLLDAGEVGGWPMRARWGWWREFMRRYAQHIDPLADGIESSVFAVLPDRAGDSSVEARAEGMVRQVWSDALQPIACEKARTA